MFFKNIFKPNINKIAKKGDMGQLYFLFNNNYENPQLRAEILIAYAEMAINGNEKALEELWNVFARQAEFGSDHTFVPLLTEILTKLSPLSCSVLASQMQSFGSDAHGYIYNLIIGMGKPALEKVLVFLSSRTVENSIRMHDAIAYKKIFTDPVNLAFGIIRGSKYIDSVYVLIDLLDRGLAKWTGDVYENDQLRHFTDFIDDIISANPDKRLSAKYQRKLLIYKKRII